MRQARKLVDIHKLQPRAKRLRLAFDVSEEFRRQYKAAASLRGLDMGEMFVRDAREKYPNMEVADDQN